MTLWRPLFLRKHSTSQIRKRRCADYGFLWKRAKPAKPPNTCFGKEMCVPETRISPNRQPNGEQQMEITFSIFGGRLVKAHTCVVLSWLSTKQFQLNKRPLECIIFQQQIEVCANVSEAACFELSLSLTAKTEEHKHQLCSEGVLTENKKICLTVSDLRSYYMNTFFLCTIKMYANYSF